MSVTATPMWSIRPKSMGGAVYRRLSAGPGVRVRRRAPRDRDLRPATRDLRLDDPVDVLALQHLVHEQLGRQRLERVAVLPDQPAPPGRAAVSLLHPARGAQGGAGDPLLPLVADRAGRVRDRVVVGGQPARAD